MLIMLVFVDFNLGLDILQLLLDFPEIGTEKYL